MGETELESNPNVPFSVPTHHDAPKIRLVRLMQFFIFFAVFAPGNRCGVLGGKAAKIYTTDRTEVCTAASMARIKGNRNSCSFLVWSKGTFSK